MIETLVLPPAGDCIAAGLRKEFEGIRYDVYCVKELYETRTEDLLERDRFDDSAPYVIARSSQTQSIIGGCRLIIAHTAEDRLPMQKWYRDQLIYPSCEISRMICRSKARSLRVHSVIFARVQELAAEAGCEAIYALVKGRYNRALARFAPCEFIPLLQEPILTTTGTGVSLEQIPVRLVPRVQRQQQSELLAAAQ